MGLTARSLFLIGESKLKDKGAGENGIDAEALLGFLTGMDRKELFFNRDLEMSDEQVSEFMALLSRRANGEPLQYITGEQYFMGHRFSVDPSVLIPRPETELLAEKATHYINGHGVKTVLDLCTGSGVLAISIALACPGVRITASDVSAQALVMAQKNAEALLASDRVEFAESDLFSAITGKFGLIVTNPPYIRTEDLDGLQREIKDHEPLQALDGGQDGLDFYRRIAAEARSYLCPGACLMTEIGADQAEAVSSLFRESGFAGIEIFKDLNSFDRFLSAVIQ